MLLFEFVSILGKHFLLFYRNKRRQEVKMLMTHYSWQKDNYAVEENLKSEADYTFCSMRSREYGFTLQSTEEVDVCESFRVRYRLQRRELGRFLITGQLYIDRKKKIISSNPSANWSILFWGAVVGLVSLIRLLFYENAIFNILLAGIVSFFGFMVMATSIEVLRITKTNTDL